VGSDVDVGSMVCFEFEAAVAVGVVLELTPVEYAMRVELAEEEVELDFLDIEVAGADSIVDPEMAPKLDKSKS
jgi:hypothetical protein